MSRPLIIANWKMNLIPSEAEGFVAAFRAALGPHAAALGRDVDVAIAPAFPALDRLRAAIDDEPIALAAQTLSPEASGAFTGEVSRAMLEDLGCEFALIGHSERRHVFGEQDADVAARARRLADSAIAPVLCVGETLIEREHEATLEIVDAQLSAVLAEIDDSAEVGLGARLVVAYEPVWAIGTGKTATPEIAQQVHAAIRKTLVARLGETGRMTRILYGGSVKPENTRELLAQADVDGALVGGASLDPNAFAMIVAAALENS